MKRDKIRDKVGKSIRTAFRRSKEKKRYAISSTLDFCRKMDKSSRKNKKQTDSVHEKSNETMVHPLLVVQQPQTMYQPIPLSSSSSYVDDHIRCIQYQSMISEHIQNQSLLENMEYDYGLKNVDPFGMNSMSHRHSSSSQHFEYAKESYERITTNNFHDENNETNFNNDEFVQLIEDILGSI